MDLKRKLLLGDGDSVESPVSEDISSEELDNVLTQHHIRREKLTETIRRMTASMKEQSLMAENIIKRDNKFLSKVTDLVDKNKGDIEKEHKKFQNKENKLSTFNICILLLFVLIVFIYMVLFIRLMKK